MKSNPESKNHKLSKKKTLIFKLGAVLFSVVILVIIEGLLILAGYGHNFDLFIEDHDDASSWVINPDVSKKYFSDNSSATAAIATPFKKQKEPETFRIFVLGASTGIGYPYKYNGSFHHWLTYALNRTYLNQHFEVINVSMTAINSYTLLDFSKQIVDYEPDAVLIYAGHNEYYGALGAASTSALGNQPWMVNFLLKLKTLRITQLLSNSISAITSDSDLDGSKEETLMKKMVQEQKIPFNSKLYHQGLVQFESNVNAIFDILEAHAIPTFVGTLVSNIKDVKPFISEKTSENQPAQQYYDQGMDQFERLNFTEAKSNFIKAKELDMLRFRAPEAMNQIIKKTVKNYANAVVVESHDIFENYTSEGIIGNELLLEHVHPNIRGYALLGYSFYEALVEADLVKNETVTTSLDFDQLWQEMPITALDSVAGTYEILMLKEGWPYYEKMPQINPEALSTPEKIAGRLAIQDISWNEASQRLYQYYDSQNDPANALKVMEGATLMYPQDANYYEKSAELAVEAKQFNKADYLYRSAFAINNSKEMAKKVARSFIENEAYQTSLFYLEAIKKVEPENQFAIKLFKVSSKIITLQNQIDGNAANADLGIELAENYILVGNKLKAIQILTDVLNYHPQNEEAKSLIKTIK
jgi:Tfp pilus assembly protein PilF